MFVGGQRTSCLALGVGEEGMMQPLPTSSSLTSALQAMGRRLYKLPNLQKPFCTVHQGKLETVPRKNIYSAMPVLLPKQFCYQA